MLFSFVALADPPTEVKHEVIEVTGLNDTMNYCFIQDPSIYTERWDTLAQPLFWCTVMSLQKDSGVINIGSTRKVLEVVALANWNKQTDEERTAYRDSVKFHYCLPYEEHVYLTSGKKHFYNFEKVLPSVNRALPIFQDHYVDPWYAQTILLIESPGKLAKSPAGAYGSFQLMRKVARKMGLVVDRYTDERKDFDKSAWAAAKLLRTICIPETNNMLDARCIPYEGNELWYRLLVLHVYHAGASNVAKALDHNQCTTGGMGLITTLWQTEHGHFRNSSQNYTQVAIASLLKLDELIYQGCNHIYSCPDEEPVQQSTIEEWPSATGGPRYR